jgi:DNA helicase HerA-like ATPase
MAQVDTIFSFDLENDFVGKVVYVDTNRLILDAKFQTLHLAKVGRLMAVKIHSLPEEWVIAIVERVIKNQSTSSYANQETQKDDSEENYPAISLNIANMVHITSVATYKTKDGTGEHYFSRSIQNIPDIDAEAFCIENDNLERFMKLLSVKAKSEVSLEIGRYSISEKARAQLDGNKFFQRHAAILGSTGSGKSWTVASILEKAAELPTVNIIVFDLHGEYNTLQFAKHLRIPGPDELNSVKDSLLFLPYWLLNSEEIQAMFIDRSEFTAHNQVMMFQKLVGQEKKAFLESQDKTELLKTFTIDSPVPYNLNNVIIGLNELNDEKKQGSRGLKQGDFNGQFSRLLARLDVKLTDKRYGFLFQYPESLQLYSSFHKIARQLLEFRKDEKGIKVIDFSEVPSEILPVIIGLVARIIYNIQFWTNEDERQPLAMICDEAHLYLPKVNDTNKNERRALENFEKIAKEGRKYGVSLVVVSQRPSDISETILSQCNNIMALRLSNKSDQNTINAFMPDSLSLFADILPTLDIGETIILGDAVMLPSRILLDKPRVENRPRSATIDFWTEWNKSDKITDFERSVENYRKQSRRNEN